MWVLTATFDQVFSGVTLWLEGVTHEETEKEEVLSQLGAEELGASGLKSHYIVNVHLSIEVCL